MNIPKKYQERIQEIFRDDDGYWIYLKKGWRKGDDICHTLAEDTQKQLMWELRQTKPCDCEWCTGKEN